MVRVTYVTCPECAKEFYLRTADYKGNKEAYAECPFCYKQFNPAEGKPYPPLDGA